MIESFVNIESASQLAGNVPFQNFVQGDERVTSWSEIQDGRDCAITVRCTNNSGNRVKSQIHIRYNLNHR